MRRHLPTTCLGPALAAALLASCERAPAPTGTSTPPPTGSTAAQGAGRVSIGDDLVREIVQRLATGTTESLSALVVRLSSLDPESVRTIRFTVSASGKMSAQGIEFEQSAALYKALKKVLDDFGTLHDRQETVRAHESMDQLFAAVMLGADGNSVGDTHNFLMPIGMRGVVLKNLQAFEPEATQYRAAEKLETLTRIARQGTKHDHAVP